MILEDFQSIKSNSNTTMDMSANFSTDPIKSRYMNGIFIQLTWTGTPSGTFTFYSGIGTSKSPSIYEKLRIVTVVSGIVTQVESPIDGVQAIGANFQTSSVALDSDSNANWYKVVWTGSGGTGTAQGNFLAKSNG